MNVLFHLFCVLAAYEFAWGPPENAAQRSPPNLKEWNAAVNSTDDVFSLDELVEFKSTELDFLLLGSVKRVHPEEVVDEPSPKRRKLDVGSLRNVVPQVVQFLSFVLGSH